MAAEEIRDAREFERGVASHIHGLEASGTAAVWNDSNVHGLRRLARLLRLQAGGRPENEERRSEAIDPSHVTTSHAPNPSPLVRTLADPYDPTDDFLMKDSVDYFGTSFYPKLTAVEYNWKLNRRVLAMDLTASMTGGRGFYVGELQSGFGVHGTTIGSEVTPNDLQMWAWGMVSRGARAISFYAFYPMNAGYESGGYGMIQLDGTLTERSKRAGETAKKIEENGDLLLSAKPR